MNHDRTLAALSEARDFLVAHPDIPTPMVSAWPASRGGTLQLDWHCTDDNAPALEVLRAFVDWRWTARTQAGNVTCYSTIIDGIELRVFAATIPDVATEPVDLLEALAEVSA